MKQEVVMNPSISDDNLRFLCLNSFDRILKDEKNLKKKTIVEVIRNLRDEIDRF